MSNKVGIDSQEWFLQAKYDLKSADVMFENKQYIHAVFMCHLAVEKALKGVCANKAHGIPPRTHNLIFLSEKAKLVLSEEHSAFLAIMDSVSVPTRYPDELKSMRKVYTKSKTRSLLERSKGMVRWLKNNL